MNPYVTSGSNEQKVIKQVQGCSVRASKKVLFGHYHFEFRRMKKINKTVVKNIKFVNKLQLTLLMTFVLLHPREATTASSFS